MIWHTLTDDEKFNRKTLQIQYEQNMLEYGRNKYWSDYDRAPDEGIPEQELIDSSIKELEDRFQEWIDRSCESRKSPEWIYPLLEMGARKMADITIRSVVKCWFSSSFWGYQWNEGQHTPPLAQSVATQIAQETCDIIGFQRAKNDFREDWLKQSKFIKNWTPKRCCAFTKKVERNIKLTVKQKHNFGHAMLRIAASSNIIKLEARTLPKGRVLRKYLFVEFHEEVLRELHRRHDLLQASVLVYRPMLSIPEDHTLISSGGYIHTRLRKPVVQRYKSNFFGDRKRDQNHSEPSQLVLDGLNHMMKTEWSVNRPVLKVMKNLFENNTGLANLPYYNFEGFMYNEDYPIDGSKEQQAKWCQQREDAWGEWYKQEQARGRMLVRLELSKDLLEKEFFYHVYSLDFRGRAYTTCELLSPQSSDFDRGLIMLATRRELTPRGLYWLKVNLANLFDQDKISFDDRVRWVDDNWDMILKISEDPYEHREWIDDAKKKNKSFQRLAAIYDITMGDNCSSIPVQLDGKCNGNQHWSAIMGDPVIADLTSVMPAPQPKDLYQFVADKTTDLCIKFRSSNDWFDEFLTKWDNKIDRKVTKRSTMCEPYGLTFYGIQRYLKTEGHLDWIEKDRRGAAITELARAIQNSLDISLAEPNKGKQYLKEIVGIANDLNRHIGWTTPSGFKVVHHYNKNKTRRSLAKLYNTKELIFFIRTKDVDVRSALQAIAPNYIHSLDAAHMFLVIHELIYNFVYDICMIHDSYGCHANDVDTMRIIINQKFYDIHSVNQLEILKRDVENQLGVMLPDVPNRGTLDISEVLQSDYFFS